MSGGRGPLFRRLPLDLGPLFDTLAEQRPSVDVRLGRPLDLAPERGTGYDTAQLAELVRETAAWLAAAGAGPGSSVAVVKRNHWDYVLLACAAARIGAVPALLSDRVPPEALGALLRRLRADVLVTQRGVLAGARAAGVELTAPAGRTVCLDGDWAGALTVDGLRGGPVPAVRSRGEDEPLAVIHTSGTTGVPKLVVHSTRTLIRRLSAFEARPWPVLSARREDTVASAISFAHGRALTWTVSAFWRAPRTVALLPDSDPATAAALLGAHPPTVLEALPSSYVRWQPLTAGADNPFRDVRLFISTFDAMHPPTVRAFLDATRRRRPLWMQGWGQSETGPLSFRFLTRGALAASGLRHPTTRDLGRPVPGWVRVKVADPRRPGRTARPGETGLLYARTGALCLGYLDEPERWGRKLDGGWFNTGDLGTRTRDGRVFVLDREVDMVPGLSCVELEDVLHERLPDVEEAVLLSVADGRPQPVLVTADGALDPARWRDAVRDLPPLAEPLVVGWDAVPRTATGKVRRHELRERVLAGSAGIGTGLWT
ncbi:MULTISPECIES: class I adenylate-forming enzyme family protein [Kitasatospora]|uniref:Putative acyl-CoA synthetase n=1 Tax=Kitasatospora setae (strain ATCC 33774 / DSM 43861 / JCM 3304 / KCC A-0304 / NBRC 14216 / KM-6054) TaxID=452652 RepID=E4N843_KITSK|nr:class I adenylate-forming enzyme family protein [Kitasatospora setae]BAJ27374.1 putative acyl-CoA synthetase [Kitasatospora setae KM-6054]